MPAIRPFRGVIYNQKKTRRLSSVVCPPYDIIPPDMQDELYRKSPHNFVKIELNKIEQADDDRSNRYTRARNFFEAWLRDRILVRDEKEALYIYSQKYKEGRRIIERTGFIGLMGLDEKDAFKVLPHENTLAAPKADRLKMMHSVRANLSPIFVLYEDKAHKISQMLKKVSSASKTFIDINIDGVRHKVWRLSDKEKIKTIERLMKDKDIFIADGHHRYETSRNYALGIQNDRNASPALRAASKYVMVYFVESDERMLTILPAHRVIKDADGLKREDILERLGKYFNIKKMSGLNALMAMLGRMSARHAFGMYLGKGGFYILTLKDIKDSDKVIKDKPGPWKRLDVSVLHLFVFQHVLGIRDEDDNIEFLKDPKDAVSYVDEGCGKAAFFLNPTTASQVRQIARLGERMPRKATYFYPKPLSGLVVNKLG